METCELCEELTLFKHRCQYCGGLHHRCRFCKMTIHKCFIDNNLVDPTFYNEIVHYKKQGLGYLEQTNPKTRRL